MLAGRGIEDEPGGAGVYDDRHTVLGPHLVHEHAERRLQQRQFVRGLHGAGDVHEEDEIARGKVLGIDPPSLNSNAHEPVDGIPRSGSDLRVNRKWIGPLGVGQVVAEVVDQLLDTNGVRRRKLPVTDEAANVRVGRTVHVDSESGKGVGPHSHEFVLVYPVVALTLKISVVPSAKPLSR